MLRETTNRGLCGLVCPSRTCLLLQYLLQSCSCVWGGKQWRICATRDYEQKAVDCVNCCCLLLQYLIQSCACGGRRIVEDMCYETRQAEACVD